MKKTVRALSILVAALLFVSIFTACGEKASNNTSKESSGKVNAEAKGSIKLKLATVASNADNQAYKNMYKLIKDKTGYEVEEVIVPGNELDATKKMKVSLMAGDEYDFLYGNDATASGFAAPKLVLPLDDLIKETGYDVEKTYGPYIKKLNGKIYLIPNQKDVHVTFYNKKIFDDAKVSYPTPDWTWEDYLAIAKKLTDPTKGIFGSCFLEWDPYMTFSVKQKKVPAYKDDGTSNFDDPAWAESFKFFADIGNLSKVNIDYLTYKTKKLPYDMFMQGKFGMWPVGNWASVLLTDMNKYPRDFKVGITTLPQVNKGENITLGLQGGFMMASTTKHSKETFEALKALGEEAYKVTSYIPPRIDLPQDEINKVAQGIADQLKFDGITIEDLKTAILDSRMDVVNEKVMGIADDTINYTLIPGQFELYATGQKSLEAAMKELKEKADNAIKEIIEADNK
jgi:multiple sugar transport system substrate-binding protein